MHSLIDPSFSTCVSVSFLHSLEDSSQGSRTQDAQDTARSLWYPEPQFPVSQIIQAQEMWGGCIQPRCTI